MIHILLRALFCLTLISIIIIPSSIRASQPAAGSGELAQSGQSKATTILRDAAVQSLNPRLPRLPVADLKALLKAREERTAQLNDRLKKANRDTWNADKKAIQDALENDGIHPDDVQLPDGVLSYSKPPLAAACSRHDTSELPFIQFLLEHGASVNYTGYLGTSCYAIADACTVDIAALLMRYGARPDYATLYQNALYEPQYSSELVAFYLDQGVVKKEAIKPGSRSFNFLMCDLLFNCIIYGGVRCDVHNEIRPIHSAGALCRRVEILLQAGAPLSIPQGTWTIPAKVKEKIGYAQKREGLLGENALQELLMIEQRLKKHSDYRHDGIKEDLKLCKGADGAELLPALQAMIIGYFIKPEPRYEHMIKPDEPQSKE